MSCAWFLIAWSLAGAGARAEGPGRVESAAPTASDVSLLPLDGVVAEGAPPRRVFVTAPATDDRREISCDDVVVRIQEAERWLGIGVADGLAASRFQRERDAGPGQIVVSVKLTTLELGRDAEGRLVAHIAATAVVVVDGEDTETHQVEARSDSANASGGESAAATLISDAGRNAANEIVAFVARTAQRRTEHATTDREPSERTLAVDAESSQAQSVLASRSAAASVHLLAACRARSSGSPLAFFLPYPLVVAPLAFFLAVVTEAAAGAMAGDFVTDEAPLGAAAIAGASGGAAASVVMIGAAGLLLFTFTGVVGSAPLIDVAGSGVGPVAVYGLLFGSVAAVAVCGAAAAGMTTSAVTEGLVF